MVRGQVQWYPRVPGQLDRTGLDDDSMILVGWLVVTNYRLEYVSL